VIGSEVESFALQSLKQLSQEIPPPAFDYHYHHSEASNLTKDEIEEDEKKWMQIDIERHLDLFLSLCAKKRQLFEEYIYITFHFITFHFVKDFSKPNKSY
jgi:hypothetical protein